MTGRMQRSRVLITRQLLCLASVFSQSLEAVNASMYIQAHVNWLGCCVSDPLLNEGCAH